MVSLPFLDLRSPFKNGSAISIMEVKILQTCVISWRCATSLRLVCSSTCGTTLFLVESRETPTTQPCSSQRICSANSPIPLPRRLCRWLGRLHCGGSHLLPPLCDGAQSEFSSSKCQFVHPFLDRRVWESCSIDFGPDHLRRL